MEAEPMNIRLQMERNSRTDSIQPRIFSGKLASQPYPFMCPLMHVTKTKTQAPAQPSLLGIFESNTETYTEKAGLLCGCSLIGRNHAITAGHCAPAMLEMMKEGKTMELWTSTDNIKVIPPKSQRYVITKVHGAGLRSKEAFLNDLAILEFDPPVEFSQSVTRCCIGTGNYAHKHVTLVGYGLYDCHTVSPRLREIQGYTSSYDDCDPLTPKLHPDQICAKFKTEDGDVADQAPGDSGGPLFYYEEGEDYNNYCNLIGTVSFNMVDRETKCPEGTPSVFQRVGAHRSFIKKYVTDAEFCGNEDAKKEYK